MINLNINFTINWYDIIGRDEEWKNQDMLTVSEAQFEQEYELFLGTGNIGQQ